MALRSELQDPLLEKKESVAMTVSSASTPIARPAVPVKKIRLSESPNTMPLLRPSNRERRLIRTELGALNSSMAYVGAAYGAIWDAGTEIKKQENKTVEIKKALFLLVRDAADKYNLMVKELEAAELDKDVEKQDKNESKAKYATEEEIDLCVRYPRLKKDIEEKAKDTAFLLDHKKLEVSVINYLNALDRITQSFNEKAQDDGGLVRDVIHPAILKYAKQCRNVESGQRKLENNVWAQLSGSIFSPEIREQYFKATKKEDVKLHFENRQKEIKEDILRNHKKITELISVAGNDATISLDLAVFKVVIENLHTPPTANELKYISQYEKSYGALLNIGIPGTSFEIKTENQNVRSILLAMVADIGLLKRHANTMLLASANDYKAFDHTDELFGGLGEFTDFIESIRGLENIIKLPPANTSYGRHALEVVSMTSALVTPMAMPILFVAKFATGAALTALSMAIPVVNLVVAAIALAFLVTCIWKYCSSKTAKLSNNRDQLSGRLRDAVKVTFDSKTSGVGGVPPSRKEGESDGIHTFFSSFRRAQRKPVATPTVSAAPTAAASAAQLAEEEAMMDIRRGFRPALAASC
jgi:hypothetical protein